MKHGMALVRLFLQLCLLALPMGVLAATAVEIVIDLRAEIAAGRFDPARDSVGVRGAVPPLSWGQTATASPVPGAPGLYRLQLQMEAAAAAGQPVAHKFKIEQPGRPDAGWENGRNRSWLLDAAAVDAQRPQRVQRVFRLKCGAQFILRAAYKTVGRDDGAVGHLQSLIECTEYVLHLLQCADSAAGVAGIRQGLLARIACLGDGRACIACGVGLTFCGRQLH